MKPSPEQPDSAAIPRTIPPGTGPGVGKRTPSKSKGSPAESMRYFHQFTPKTNKALR